MNKKNIEDINPLVPVQQGMLYETILAPASGIHIEQSIYTLKGTLQITALEQAWQWGVERHSILRTGFVWKNHAEPLQVTLRQVHVVPTYQDLRDLSPQEQRERLATYVQEERARGFVLSRPPLMRLTLLQLDDQTTSLIWTFHHILLDGWSFQVLLGEIISAYTALSQGQPLPQKPGRPYSEYIRWLRAQDAAQEEQFWRTSLCGFTTPTMLGRAVPEPLTDPAQERSGTVSARLLPAPETAALQTLARRHRVTLSTVLQGVWALLLSHYSATEDVLFGVTVSGRSAPLPEIETMVGLYMNTVPLRVQVPGALSLWAWVETLQYRSTEMSAFEYSSAGQIHQWSEVPGTSLLYESILVVENYPVTSSSTENGGIAVVGSTTQGAQTKYQMTLMVTGETEIGLTCVYDAARFDHASMERVVAHFQVILTAMASGRDISLATLRDMIPQEHIPVVHAPQTSVQTPADSQETPFTRPMEELVSGVWREVLGEHAHLDRASNFFAFGGHSLLATQVTARLRAMLGIELPLRAIFEAPTIAAFTQQVEQAMRQTEGIAQPPLVAGVRPEVLPLSFAQQRLWFREQLMPDSTVYLLPAAFHVIGETDAHALERCIHTLIERHESLRTTFSNVGGEPVQVIHPAGRYRLPVVDLQGLAQEQRVEEKQRLVAQEAHRPCDLAQGPLLRTSLLRLKRDEHVFLVTFHHIITDSWSDVVFVRELASLYRAYRAGEPSPLAPLPIQYADYVLWQRQWLQGEVLESQLSYWKRQLTGITPLALPVDRQLSSENHRGAMYSFVLAQDLSEALVQLSSQEQATLFMTMLAAFQTMLQHVSGQDDIVVGTDVTNRPHIEGESLIGFFVNQLVLRTNLSRNPTFRELLQEVRKIALEAYIHQDLPFEKIIEVLRPKRQESASSLFQVKLLLDKTVDLTVKTSDMLLVPDVAVNQENVSPAMSQQEDILLRLSEGSQGLYGTFIYRADLFEEATIARIAYRFVKLLERICANPDTRLDMLKTLFEKEEKEKMEPQKRKSTFGQLKQVQPQPVRMKQEPLIKTSYLSAEEHLPLVIAPQKIELDLVEWAKSQQSFLEAELLKHGALLFRGFDDLSPADFEQFASTLCSDLFHENGEHVRAGVGAGNLYTPVFYAPEKKLLWHTENSFNVSWPMKIFFFCGQPAAKGGETPITDNRSVFERIAPHIREPFLQKGIMYVRNYGGGLGLPWQKVFQTEQQEEVEAYCQKAGITFEWKGREHLKTSQVRPAVLQHPQTGEWLWWNQAAHWHPACLEPEVRESLQLLFAEDDLPRNCFYGDGSKIEDSVIDAICEAYQAVEVSFPWRQGDILLLDNMLAAHARNPYEGTRKIYVSMGNMITLNEFTHTK